MRATTILKFGLLALGLFFLPDRLPACPSCAEAVPLSAGGEEDEEMLTGRAYNNSVYLMVGMPYVLLGAVGYLVHRGLRQRERLPAIQALQRGTQPCYPPSPGGAS